MADNVTLASTTDTEEQIREALAPRLPSAPPPAAEPVTAAPAADVAPTDSAVPLTPQKTKIQRRLSTMAREKTEALTRAEAAERELAALKARSAGEPAGPAASVVSPPAAPAAPAPVDPLLEAGPEPKEDDFEDYAKYQSAVRAWDRKVAKIEARIEAKAAAEESLKAQHQEALRRAQVAFAAEQAAKFNARLEAVKTAIPDFAEVTKAGEALPAVPHILEWCQAEPNGIVIGYYLCKHPEIYDQLAKMPAPMAWTALGRLDAKYEAGLLGLPPIGSESTSAPDARPTPAPPAAAPVTVTPVLNGQPVPSGAPALAGASRAPMPVPRVGSGVATTAADPEKMDHQQFKKWRESQTARSH